MKITELLLQNKGKVTVSFELIPPKKGVTSEHLIEKLKPLMEFKPLFVDITTHRNEIVFDTTTPHRGTTISGFTHKKHPSALAVCEAVRSAFDVEVMPHLLCCGFDKAETEDLLLDLNFLGYDNVMALRGDRLPTEHNFISVKGANNRSSDLIYQIKQLNNGVTLDSTLPDVSTDFCVGAAGYPEKYFGSPSLEYDYECYKTLKADADFLICQMFFDNHNYYNFCEDLFSLHKPVIPGIKVLSKESQLQLVPERFFVSIPDDLRVELKSDSTAGVRWATQQCKDLIAHGVEHIHFYTMNSKLVCEVLKQIL